MFFGVNTTRSCFNVTAINDGIPEDPVETVQFRIDGIRRTDIIQVSSSAQTATVAILDDDCKSLHKPTDSSKWSFDLLWLLSSSSGFSL